MPHPPISKNKFILFTFAAIILSLFLSIFVVGEIIFRLVRPKTPAISMDIYMGRPDPIFHHSYPANIKVTEMFSGKATTFSINDQGLRGREYPVSKPKDTYRILVLGDSFVFGTAVNDKETFCQELEKKLNSRAASKKYEVINCGIVSYSPLLEYILLKNKLVDYSPDLVILFYNFLDLTEDPMYARHTILNKNREVVACDPFYINGHTDYVLLLRDKFAFFSHIYNKLSKSFRKISSIGLKNYFLCILQGKSVKEYLADNPTIKSAELDSYFMFRDNVDMKVVRYYWDNSSKWIKKIKGFLNSKGSSFVLVSFPLGLQVSKDSWHSGRVACQLKENELYETPELFKMLEDFSQQNSINFINLRSHLLKHGEETLYYDFDGHWTALGHERVAEGILNNSVFEEVISK